MSTENIRGRRKTFAEKVAEGHTATEAYLLAGYHAAKRETAHRAASRLYVNPGIRAYIRELRRTGDELAREETTLTIAKKLTFLARLVLTSSATLREDDPLIQSHRILKDGSTSIRIPCKLKALKMHSELAGHFLPEPTEPTPPIDTLQKLFDQIRQGRLDVPPATLQSPRLRDEKWPPASADEQPRAVFPQENIGLTTLEAPGLKRGLLRAKSSSAHSFSCKENTGLCATTLQSPRLRDEKWTAASADEQSRAVFCARPMDVQKSPNQPPPDPPLTPVQIRKMIIAQIQQASPLHNSPIPP